MVSDPIPLEQITIASPCSAKWSEMIGDDKVRFCRLCHKNVYNFSSMGRSEAESLIQDLEGGPCVRFYRRKDGTVLTEDCLVAVHHSHRILYCLHGLLFASITIMIALGFCDPNTSTEGTVASLRRIKPIGTVIDWIYPSPPPPPAPPRSADFCMGKMRAR